MTDDKLYKFNEEGLILINDEELDQASKKEVEKSFLGLANFYDRKIEGYSILESRFNHVSQELKEKKSTIDELLDSPQKHKIPVTIIDNSEKESLNTDLELYKSKNRILSESVKKSEGRAKRGGIYSAALAAGLIAALLWKNCDGSGNSNTQPHIPYSAFKDTPVVTQVCPEYKPTVCLEETVCSESTVEYKDRIVKVTVPRTCPTYKPTKCTEVHIRSE